jgi:hypothetical protein
LHHCITLLFATWLSSLLSVDCMLTLRFDARARPTTPRTKHPTTTTTTATTTTTLLARIRQVRTMVVVQAWIVLTMLEAVRLAVLK